MKLNDTKKNQIINGLRDIVAEKIGISTIESALATKIREDVTQFIPDHVFKAWEDGYIESVSQFGIDTRIMGTITIDVKKFPKKRDTYYKMRISEDDVNAFARELLDEYKSKKFEFDEAMKAIRSTVLACSTTNQLIQLLPEADSVISAVCDVDTVKTLVPIATIERARIALKA